MSARTVASAVGRRVASSARRDSRRRFVAAVAPLFEGAPRFLGRLADGSPFGSVADVLRRGARRSPMRCPRPSRSSSSTPTRGSARRRRRSRRPRSWSRATPRGGRRRARRRRRRPIAAELERLNAAYEARFGFRYCVFVAGRPRAALLPDMAAALDGGPRRRAPSRARRSRRHRDAIATRRPRAATTRRTDDDRARREPLRQGRHPARPRRVEAPAGTASAT